MGSDRVGGRVVSDPLRRPTSTSCSTVDVHVEEAGAGRAPCPGLWRAYAGVDEFYRTKKKKLSCGAMYPSHDLSCALIVTKIVPYTSLGNCEP